MSGRGARVWDDAWLGVVEGETEDVFGSGSGVPVMSDRHAVDPVAWLVDVLGYGRATLEWSSLPEYRGHEWDGTVDPLATAARALAAGQDVGIESGVGTGKTYLLSGLAPWYLLRHPESLVLTLAPKEDQLTLQMWRYLSGHLPVLRSHYPMLESVKLRLRVKPASNGSERWAMFGYAVGVDAGEKSATRAQGFHADRMLTVYEETPGIDHAVMAALGNTQTGEHNQQMAVGNPDHQLDALHQFCRRKSVVHIRISALDHPNLVCGRTVMPGGPSPKWIDGQTSKYGAGTTMWNSRVRGMSPAESDEALIKLDWCEAAVALSDQPGMRTGRKAYGVDVAQSETGDLACIARGDGAVLESVEAFTCPNATTLGEELKVEVEGLAPTWGIPLVGVDPIGVGAATFNALRETPGVFALNGGSRPHDSAQRADQGDAGEWMGDANLFLNLRAQMYWQMREDLRMRRVAFLERDLDVFAELTMPKWSKQHGRVRIESKDDIRRRLGRSPDKADAVVYWNWVRARSPEEVTGEEFRAFSPEALTAERDRMRKRDPLARPNQFGPRPGDRWHPAETL